MNVFQGYEKAKQDAIKYLYPDAQVGVEIQPKPDCPVHELLLNFILPKVEDNCSKIF